MPLLHASGGASGDGGGGSSGGGFGCGSKGGTGGVGGARGKRQTAQPRHLHLGQLAARLLPHQSKQASMSVSWAMPLLQARGGDRGKGGGGEVGGGVGGGSEGGVGGAGGATGPLQMGQARHLHLWQLALGLLPHQLKHA
eukprot:6435832-Prymnesium_polylepis.1